jgi:uncharacterized membrane protein HdeD (DUF308 family)
MQSFGTETLEVAQRYWRMALVRGIVLIIFGLLALFWPHLTFKLFFILFGIFAILEGIVLVINAFAQRKSSQAGVSYQRGAPYGGPGTTQGRAYDQQSEPGRGAYQRSEPAQSGVAYRTPTAPKNWTTLLVEGILSIICGILCLILPAFAAVLAVYAIAAWAIFKGIGAFMQMGQRGWVMGVIGVLALIMGLILFFNPIGAIRAFLWGVGLLALIMGILLVVRGLQHNAATHAAPPPEPSY